MFANRKYVYWIGIILGLLLSGCAQNNYAPLPTVASVDLSRYTGDWYEVALIPNRFQKMCIADTQANYRVDGDVIRVRNRCKTVEGKMEEANGIAKIAPQSGNAKLRVSFFRPFYGDYWILALDPEYQWVLVGEPSRKYGWILARSPKLDGATVQSILDKAEVLGYKREDFHLSVPSQP
jgi:apolipoprotein D and lipocalin family protein